MMHLDTDQSLLHHLVAADGKRDVRGHDVTSPAVVVMAAVCTIITLVSVMAMCVCHKKKGTVTKEPGEPMLKELTPVVEKKSNNINTMVNSPVEDTEIIVTIDTRNSRHSNGSVVMGKEAADNGRPKSHDQRALPEIPAGSVPNGVMQTDDEDEDEGHYDIISRHRAMAASISAASVSNTSTSASRGLNLYEKVGNGSSDMSLPSMKNTNSSTDFVSGRNPNPYATVEGIGIADYAHIDEQTKHTSKKGPVQRVQGMETQSGASTDTLNESYASVPPPPVPDKNFVNPDNGASLTPNTLESVSPENSPGLTLRSSITVTSAEVAAELAPVAPLATIAPTGDVVAVTDISNEVQGDTGTGKREPPYSSVTARESLANLRQRQAIERQQLQPLPHDATYESVNYDQITSPAVANLNMMTSDRNSLASDLYAEIASGSGENSTRSSVYAKVGDVSSVVRETPAPTPPPMDFLKHLPKESSKTDDEVPDPGYSVIRRTRPASAYSMVNTSPQPKSPEHEESSDQPVYAIVDKSRRNRNTVCVSEDVNKNLDLPDGRDPIDQMYAQVNKQRRVPTHLDFPQALPASAYVGTGARPKVRNGNNNPGSTEVNDIAAGTSQVRTSCASDIDPAYQTIPSDENGIEPGYEDIQMHNQITELSTTDFDPNYECVHTESISRIRMISPGVATEISESDMITGNNPHGMVHISDHHVDSNFWQRREHVYQEIGSTQHRFELIDRLGEHNLQQISTDL